MLRSCFGAGSSRGGGSYAPVERGDTDDRCDRRQPKIALRCVDTEELEALAAQARSRSLCARTIQDA